MQYPLSSLLDNRLSDTVNETLLLHEQGASVEAIANEREIKETTVYMHLADAIEVGLLDAKAVLDLSETDYLTIVRMIESFDDGEKGKLKPVYDALDGEYNYGVLRCVRASL